MSGRVTCRKRLMEAVLGNEAEQKRVAVEQTEGVDEDEGCSDVFPLLALPVDVLVYVLSKLDAISLVNIELTARSFRARHAASRLRITEQAAREALETRFDNKIKLDSDWRLPSWKQRLYLEDAGAGFDTTRGKLEGFAFEKGDRPNSVKHIKLVGLGPKMLVSDVSSHQEPRLRWRLRVKGNTAVEFGVVPVSLQERKKALHKCLTETGGMLCVGFCSQITVGSQLPFKVPVVKGTIVEMIVQDGKASFMVMNPSDGWDVRWENDRRVHSQYRGPGDIHFVQEFPRAADVKLALTAWAKADFDVMHACGHTASICSARKLLEEEMGSAFKMAARRSSLALDEDSSSAGEQRNSGDEVSPRSLYDISEPW
ncbi:hypothetical protein BSKO_00297 [Bryopsis sp. KO-2023]|nr:hypothetical protein BSKO_00297 [Bryopsis sp. KO-2023]